MTRAHAEPADASPHVAVIGGGVSGLVAAERLAAGGARVTLLEAGARLGGMVHTEYADPLVLERGADSVVAAKPATRALCERLGIADRLLGPAVRGALVSRGARLRRLPAGLSGLMPTRLGPLATSRVLSPRGLARVALEPWQPPADGSGDESLEAFVTRRLGREAYERLVEPLLTGIYAGDGARLSVGATFPQLRAIEREHGSLVRGLRARSRGAALPASPFLSFPRGMQELVDALERALRASGRVEVRFGAAVRLVRGPGPAGGSPVVVLAGGEWLAADAVVVAAPVPRAGTLLAASAPDVAAELGAVAHGSTATITLAYARAAVPHALDATGYVVPRVEGRDVLACTFVSSKWAGRAPADVALFRVFVGGVHRAELVERDDAALVALARAELRATLGVAAAPRVTRVARWVHAMPQYELGHPERIARVQRLLAARPWLALAGNGYAGVGVPDCIRAGEAGAVRALAAARAPAPALAASA